jgi:hypothetical protein
MFIVTINKNFYPEVEYYDTLEEADSAVAEYVELYHDSSTVKEVLISISTEIEQTIIKCDF